MDPIWARKNWGLLVEQQQRARVLENEDGGGEAAPGEIDPRLAGGGAPRRG